MRRRKNPPPPTSLFDPASIVASVRGLVDPQPMVDAEFARAKRELLARAEQDMTFWERVRFRWDLLRLRSRYRKLRNEIAKW